MMQKTVHLVTLSNGSVLRVEEGDYCLHIATEDNGEAGAYICQISDDGVLVMNNSCDASRFLTGGLARLREVPGMIS